MHRSWLPSLVVVTLLGTVVAADVTFTSTWKSPEAAGTSFAGRKVATLVMSDDDSLRVSGEEGLAHELTARGVVPVASYRLVPREELRNAESARGWYERAGVEGVVALRLVSAEKERTYSPSTWSTGSYGTLWGYYGYGWTGVYSPGQMREDTVIVIETMVFSVPRNALLWAGVSSSRNPKSMEKLLGELVAAAVKEMRKQGLIQK